MKKNKKLNDESFAYSLLVAEFAMKKGRHSIRLIKTAEQDLEEFYITILDFGSFENSKLFIFPSQKEFDKKIKGSEYTLIKWNNEFRKK